MGDDPVGQRRALLVASYEFADPGLQALRAPAHDVAQLGAVLGDPEIGGFDVTTVVNGTAPVINEAVETFFTDSRSDDLLLIYYSGHGVRDANGDLFLTAPTTRLDRLGSTGVAADFLTRQMNRTSSRRVVMLLDCCYAGAIGRGMVHRGGDDIAIQEYFGGTGRAIITASTAKEFAYEAEQTIGTGVVGTSVFTTALVDGLVTGEADRNQDGVIGLGELYDYIYDRVRQTTPNQTPSKWVVDLQGDLNIARRSRPVDKPAPLPRDVVDAMASSLPGVREAAVPELARLLRGSHLGLQLAARQALTTLAADDSRRVAAVAQEALTAEPVTLPDPAPDVPAQPVPGPSIPAHVTPTPPAPERAIGAPDVSAPDIPTPKPAPTVALARPATGSAPWRWAATAAFIVWIPLAVVSPMAYTATSGANPTVLLWVGLVTGVLSVPAVHLTTTVLRGNPNAGARIARSFGICALGALVILLNAVGLAVVIAVAAKRSWRERFIAWYVRNGGVIVIAVPGLAVALTITSCATGPFGAPTLLAALICLALSVRRAMPEGGGPEATTLGSAVS
jgi:hypothetical protein